MVCLQVTISMDKMDFSTSEVMARRVVEEESSTQRNSHVVIANITGIHRIIES